MAENAIVSAPPALLDTCLKIVKTLHRVQQWIKPAPLTMTSLANECLGLHEILRQGRDRMDAAQSKQPQLVKTMEGFLLGCSMTVSVVDEYAMELHEAVTLIVSTITDTALKADVRLLWKEEDMKELLSQTRGYQNRLRSLLDSFDKTDTLRQTSERTFSNQSTLINLINRSHSSFQKWPNSIHPSLRDSFISLDPSPPYALSLHGDAIDAIKHVAEDVSFYLSEFDSVHQSQSSLRRENAPEDTVASNEDDGLHEYHEPSNPRTRKSNPSPALAVATEKFEDDDMYDPMLAVSPRPYIRDVESSTSLTENSSNINATVANNVKIEAISTPEQLATRPVEAATHNAKVGSVLSCRITIAGSKDSGKTELMNWFYRGLDEESPFDLYSGRICEIDDANVFINLIDNLGSFLRYDSLRRTQGILLVYRTSSRASFEEAQFVEYSVSRIKEERAIRDVPEHPVLLVAYGIEWGAVQQVSREEGQTLALKLGCTFIEVSDKDYGSLREAVYDVTRLVRKRSSNYTPDQPRFGPIATDRKESHPVSEREPPSLTRRLLGEIWTRRRG